LQRCIVYARNTDSDKNRYEGNGSIIVTWLWKKIPAIHWSGEVRNEDILQLVEENRVITNSTRKPSCR